VTDHSIKIDTSTSSPFPKKRRGWLFWFLVLAVFWTMADLIGVLIPMWANREADARKTTAEAPTLPLNVEADQAPLDESKLQWTSPTSGPPITLEYVPQRTQVLLHLRPADLMAHGEGEKVLAALGPWGNDAVAQVEEFCGARISEIGALLVALIRVEGRWDYTFRATFRVPRTDVPSGIAGRTAFLPAAGQGRVVISCPTTIAEELRGQGDTPPLLARDLGRLLPLTDQHRSATLLMPTKFLDTEGRELFTGGGERFIGGFDALVPDNASAVMVSCDWRENFFCELAATIVQNAPAHRFNAELAAQLSAAEKRLAESLIANPPHAYGKTVEARFPAMLRTMSDYTRVSHENSIAIARCYLPVQAGHNLLLASRLRLSEAEPGIESATVEFSLADRLQQISTLSFPKETLENALEILAADARLPIQIAGRDLQLEGITKNQTFALDLRNRPAAEILVEVLRRANPDREANGPNDPRQKLVYVIRDEEVIVTTRAAAAQRGEQLPEVFRVREP
jgi:hypothetical protein